jgi:hypothetical protein
MAREKGPLKAERLKAAKSIGVRAMSPNVKKWIPQEHKLFMGPALLPWVYRIL